MSEKSSKEKIMEAAAQLFYYNGFKGTSIRAITDRADVNVSLISYYFKNKQGLLEHMTVEYFETYLTLLEDLTKDEETLQDWDTFFHLVEEIIHYKYEHFQFTCFIQRELSLDNMFIRELFSTYVAKEKYLLEKITHLVADYSQLPTREKEVFYIQLKSLLNGPFVYANDWQSHYQWDGSEKLFIKTYIETFKKWFSTSKLD
ncbi:forespore capture DNA-binding protein RefZ [Bacillaceae bacterium W0354]